MITNAVKQYPKQFASTPSTRGGASRSALSTARTHTGADISVVNNETKIRVGGAISFETIINFQYAAISKQYGFSASTWKTGKVPEDIVGEAMKTQRWLKFPNTSKADESVFEVPVYTSQRTPIPPSNASSQNQNRILEFSPQKPPQGSNNNNNSPASSASYSSPLAIDLQREEGKLGQLTQEKGVITVTIRSLQRMLNAQNCDPMMQARLADDMREAEQKEAALDIDLEIQKSNIREVRALMAKNDREVSNDRIKKYSTYVEKCSQMIGALYTLCNYSLQYKLDNHPEYKEASEAYDLVRCLFIVKTICLNADASNAVGISQNIFNQISRLRYVDGDFNRYRNDFLRLYSDYKFSNGPMPELSIVHILINNVGPKFRTKTDEWNEDPTKRPTTVFDCLCTLDLYLSRVVNARSRMSDSDPDGRAKRARADPAVDEEPTARSFAATTTTATPAGTHQFVKAPPGSCYDFFSKGSCTRGSSCKYKHISKNSVVNDPGVMYCQEVLKFARCELGSQCPNAAHHKISGAMHNIAKRSASTKSTLHVSIDDNEPAVETVEPFVYDEMDEPEYPPSGQDEAAYEDYEADYDDSIN